jgi:BlaI family transcriptional regulator, penicillinase repressor
LKQIPLHSFSRRERQIMDVLYKQGEASVTEVLQALPDAPSYSSVRTLLRILEEKGQVTHAEAGKRYVYRAAGQHDLAARSTIEHVVDTFFGGNIEDAVATLLSTHDLPSDDELSRLEELIKQARDRKRHEMGEKK